MKKQHWILFCIPFLTTVRLFAPSIDTTQGPNLDKSMTITALWNMNASATETAMGSVLFTQGLRITGTGEVWLGLHFPIQKQLNLRGVYGDSTSGIRLKDNLHLAEGTIIYGSNEGLTRIQSPVNEHWTIYLDGDVTISGNASDGSQSMIVLENVDIDGQGHSLILGPNSRAGGLIMSANIKLRNLTLKNCWNRNFDGTGTLFYSGITVPFINNSAIFENVNFIARRGLPMGFFMYGNYAPFNYIIKGTTTFGNFGEYYLLNIGPKGSSYFIIEENSNLIIQDSTFYSGIWVDSDDGVSRPIKFWFKSDTSHIILDNSVFSINNNFVENAGNLFRGALDQTVTLTRGTLIVRGASVLQATTDLMSANRKARFCLGDGVDPANDFNIIIDTGARLDVIASTTNSSVVFQNVH